MVFTSIQAAYLDAANWQQQQQQTNHQHGNTSSTTTQQHLQPPLPPPVPLAVVQPNGVGTSAGSIRPGSMADRARMANLPMPEAALRCPRCDSTNTKFCYFNNYSLSQPRHFCKTCRRYWTRGGALRNVPVGGGCRRNKRSSKGTNSSSKSPAASSDRPTGSASSTNSAASSGSASDIVGLNPSIPPLRFMAPLLHHNHHQLSDFASGGGDMSLNYGINNNYGTISGGIGDLSSFQIGNSLNSSILLSGASSLDQWRVPQTTTQQFPFLAGLEGSSSHGNSGSLYPFEGGSGAEILSGYVRPKVSTSGLLTQLASVKMEDSNNNNNNHRNLNLSGQFLGTSSSNHNNIVSVGSDHNQYWNNVVGGGHSGGVNGNGGGNGNVSASAAWTNLSGFNSSSTTSNQL